MLNIITEFTNTLFFSRWPEGNGALLELVVIWIISATMAAGVCFFAAYLAYRGTHNKDAHGFCEMVCLWRTKYYSTIGQIGSGWMVIGMLIAFFSGIYDMPLVFSANAFLTLFVAAILSILKKFFPLKSVNQSE